MTQAEQIHATSVIIDGHGILIAGVSGAGKSDLALRLIDRGAVLVSDDYSMLKIDDGVLMARPPLTIVGKMEIRGIGIVNMPHKNAAPILLFVDLDAPVERYPDPPRIITLLGQEIASIALNAHEASAPIKVEWALKHILGRTSE